MEVVDPAGSRKSVVCRGEQRVTRNQLATTATAPRSIRGFDFVFFDCDSTLSTIEGIDELARFKGQFGFVSTLTNSAMAGEVPLEAVYRRRLEILAPTPEEVAGLATQYRLNVVADARDVIGALQHAGKEVFIISGGLSGAVRPFGTWLGVPVDHIRAVDIALAGPEPALLATSDGKRVVVKEMLGDRLGRSMLVGDGASDLAAREVVDLFVGFTGVVEHPRVVAAADALITGDSLAPVLGLALTESEEIALSATVFGRVVEESRTRIEAGEVTVRRGEMP